MTLQFRHGGRRHGNVTFQQVERQFVNGIDLIGVGVLQQGLTFVTIRLAQHPLQKGSLTPYTFHGNIPELMRPHRLHSHAFISYKIDKRLSRHGYVFY